MKNKFQYIVIALTILTCTPCWGAAEDALDRLPYDGIEYMIAFWDTQTLLQMAQTSTKYQKMFEHELFKRIITSHNNDPNKALMFAAINNQPYLIKYLMEHGANINATGPTNSTGIWTILMWATSFCHSDMVIQLIKAGADVNATAGGDTALMKATRRKDVKTMQALLDGKANVNQIDSNGKTALDIAKELNADTLILILESCLQNAE